MKTLDEWLKTDVAEIKKIPPAEYNSNQFFRDPSRPRRVDNNLIFSPADGIILYQREVEPDEAVVEIKGKMYTARDALHSPTFKHRSLVIGIFMSAFDVHLNRMPTGGTVKYSKVPPVQTFNTPMITEERELLRGIVADNAEGYVFNNERMRNKIYWPRYGYTYWLVQIADIEVDTITPFGEQDEYFGQGSRFSFVRYGSQVDLILPLPLPKPYTLCCADHCHVEAAIDPLVRLG